MNYNGFNGKKPVKMLQVVFNTIRERGSLTVRDINDILQALKEKYSISYRSQIEGFNNMNTHA